MELGQLCAAAGISPPDREVEVRDLAYRADAVTPGALFVCVRGARADGHDHAAEAVDRGAAALVVERRLDVALPQAVARDSRHAMGPLADAFFGRPSAELPIVAVTGTNGKTTTAYLVAGMLDAAGRRSGLLGTVRRRIGGIDEPVTLTTPEAIDLQRAFRRMLQAGDAACVIEASSIALVQGRLDGVRLAAAGFTNLTQDHLDFHGSMQDYFAAKATLFDGRCPRAVNADDDWGARLTAELRYGVASGAAEVRAQSVEYGPSGTDLHVRTPRGDLHLQSPLRGRFNVDNLLCAVALALLVDVPDEAIVAGAAAVAAPPGRFEAVEAGQPFSVIVDYAHTPAGLDAVLASARPLTRGRLVCVFGAGGDRDRPKRPLMGAAAEAGADVLYVTSDNPRSEDPEAIIAEILAGLERPGEAMVEPDRRAAIARALEDARPGDVVVIAGKGHEQGQEIAGVVHPFDDREVARALLGTPA